MKKLAIFIAFAALTIQANAQFSVSLWVDWNNTTNNFLINQDGKFDHSELADSKKYFEISPSFGYEIGNWEIGVVFGYSNTSQDSLNVLTNKMKTSKTYTIRPGIYIQRNFEITDRFSLYAALDFQYLYGKMTGDDDSYAPAHAFGVILYPGLEYKLTDQFKLMTSFSIPSFEWTYMKSSYYDKDGNLIGNGMSNNTLKLKPLNTFKDFLDGIRIGIGYCF
jgi:hypothetical protein